MKFYGDCMDCYCQMHPLQKYLDRKILGLGSNPSLYYMYIFIKSVVNPCCYKYYAYTTILVYFCMKISDFTSKIIRILEIQYVLRFIEGLF